MRMHYSAGYRISLLGPLRGVSHVRSAARRRMGEPWLTASKAFCAVFYQRDTLSLAGMPFGVFIF